MIRLDLRHELACDAETYWKCVLDGEYGHRLFVDTLHFRRYDASARNSGGHVERRVEAEPPPDGVPSILRSKLAYVEEGDLDRARSLYSFRTINRAVPTMKVAGWMHAQDVGPGRCVRRCEVHIDVTLLGLGGFVERQIASDMRRSYDVSAAFTDAWVRGKGGCLRPEPAIAEAMRRRT